MKEPNLATTKAIEAAVEEDRRYSERNPHRKNWVRRAHIGEMLSEVPPFSLPDGRWFTAVRQIGPGLRIRIFFEQAKHFDTDLTEAQAQWVFNHVLGKVA